MPAKRKTPLSPTQQRKKEHLELCRDADALGREGRARFDRYSFIHNALPELDFAEIDLRTRFFGKTVNAPLLISSMTGGFGLAKKVNRNLALAAQALGIAMGVGSQRVAIEEPSARDTFQVRDVAPDILLFANLGAVQLNYGYGVEQCRSAVEMIGADGLILHLNVLQEAVQPEGNRNFKGLSAKIAAVCGDLEVPVMAKEVGSGISADVALRLKEAGVRAIDVAGMGGTSWYAVEAKRAAKKGEAYDETFASWGIPTDESLVMVRRAVPDLELVASGGIRSGLDVAKAIALGADLCGIGQPLLNPALESAEQVIKFLERVIYGLRVAMLCVGAPDLASLRRAELARRTL
ncbi:MAG TPA: type 2 isopentenyl-diphosphate Delta-isomerase [Candidatus Acidoferrales bacterium]|nr:type 2 isopentenyl-diphosphate Delta-isomerase [Candidatus Acidoferrales bacterium]